MFWNQNATRQTPEKCFGMRRQRTKQVRNVLQSENNTPNISEKFLNQNTTHKKPEKCFGIRTQHIKQLRNVLEWKTQYIKQLTNVLELKHNTPKA